MPSIVFNPTTAEVNVSINMFVDGTVTSGGPPIEFFWEFGDGDEAAGATASVNHTYMTAGTYAVAAYFEDDNGPGIAVGQIVITQTGPYLTVTPASGAAPLTVSAQAFHVGSTVQFWDYNDEWYRSLNEINPITHRYNKPGTYNLSFVGVNLSGSSVTLSQSVTVTGSADSPTVTLLRNDFMAGEIATASGSSPYQSVTIDSVGLSFTLSKYTTADDTWYDKVQKIIYSVEANSYLVFLSLQKTGANGCLWEEELGRPESRTSNNLYDTTDGWYTLITSISEIYTGTLTYVDLDPADTIDTWEAHGQASCESFFEAGGDGGTWTTRKWGNSPKPHRLKSRTFLNRAEYATTVKIMREEIDQVWRYRPTKQTSSGPVTLTTRWHYIVLVNYTTIGTLPGPHGKWWSYPGSFSSTGYFPEYGATDFHNFPSIERVE